VRATSERLSPRTTREEYPGAEPFLPEHRDLASLSEAVHDCRGCDLYRHATQAVFGEGAPSPRLVLVGEQPGAVEDQEGEPFVGPAGRLLDRALTEAGIERDRVYLTNAVKHFRFTTAGKRRIHESPSRWQVAACQPWLLAELEALRPQGIVALGAVAAKALLGSGFRVTAQRGEMLAPPDGLADWLVATVHPSSVLRSRNRSQDFSALVADLRVAVGALH
jgi:uracil-DNA glycosylase family protein